MGINYKGSQGQTERAVVLYEEEEELRFTARLYNRLICRHNIDFVYTDEHRKTIFVVLAKRRTTP